MEAKNHRRVGKKHGRVNLPIPNTEKAVGFTFFVGTDGHRYYTGLTRVRFQRNLRTILEYEERRIDYIIRRCECNTGKSFPLRSTWTCFLTASIGFPYPLGSIFRINFNRTMFKASLAVRLMISNRVPSQP